MLLVGAADLTGDGLAVFGATFFEGADVTADLKADLTDGCFVAADLLVAFAVTRFVDEGFADFLTGLGRVLLANGVLALPTLEDAVEDAL